MALLSHPVTVRVPATSANLGPGFDSLGLALALYDTVTARAGDDGIRVSVRGEGAGELPADERHLIAATMLTTFGLLGERPAGLEISCQNAIPQARGLGSSSAAIVAGVVLARELTEGGRGKLDQAEVIRLAARIEGHPDNVAPCVLGGFTIAWAEEALAAGEAQEGEAQEGEAHAGKAQQQEEQIARVRAIRVNGVRDLRAMIFVPPGHGYTAHARAALPDWVPLRDAAFNAARSALLVRALTGTPELLFEATRDRLHQDYRAATMPESAKLLATLRSARIAATISGAGPSVLALFPAGQPAGLDRAAELCPDGWRAMELAIADDGADLGR